VFLTKNIMAFDKVRLLEVIIAIIGGAATVFGLEKAAERIMILATGVLTILIAMTIYLSAELEKSKDKLKSLQKQVDYREELRALDKSYKEALHNVDKRITLLEYKIDKMNKKGGQDWVGMVGVIFLMLIGYMLYVLLSQPQMSLAVVKP